MNWEARARALQKHVDDLEFQVENLKCALTASGVLPIYFVHLTVSERSLAQLLRSRSPETVSKDAMYDLLYAFRHEDEAPDPKIIDVLVCKMRPKLARHGIEIETQWGNGYVMPAASAKIWDEKVAEAKS